MPVPSRALVVRAALAATAVAATAACAGRHASIERLVERLGVDDARAELRFRIASDRRDLPARRALAALEAEHGRPGAAIEHLLVVERAGGPIGARWRAVDRERLASLLARRGALRAARGAAASLRDLDHARRLGARIDPAVRASARVAVALADLRHASADVRARGRRLAAKLTADPRLAGARAGAALDAVGRHGAWLWDEGARRAALDVLATWRADGGTDPGILDRWLRARRWWSVPGGDRFDADARDAALATGAPRPAASAIDPFTLPCLPEARIDDPACSPVAAAADAIADGPPWEPDLVRAAATWPPTSDPVAAAAWTVVALRASLRDGGGWLAGVRARARVAATAQAAPAWARPTLLRAAGRPGDAAVALRAVLDVELSPGARLVVAAEAAVAGLPAATVRGVLAPIAATPAAAAVIARLEPEAVPEEPEAFSAIAARAAAVRAGQPDLAPGLAATAIAYGRDPAVADRLIEDAIASGVDVAPGLAAAGALFDALGDPGRSRAMWQRAADATREPAWLLELARATARAGDGDAALVQLTEAAAVSGDAAPALIAGARALLAGGRPIHALEAAREAIGLAGPDAIVDALGVAADASAAAGRHDQGAGLRAERAALTGAKSDDATDGDATDGDAAAGPGALAIEALVVEARWHPRDVVTRRILAGLPATDSHGRRARSELASLALGPDPTVARAALAALREARPAAAEPAP